MAEAEDSNAPRSPTVATTATAESGGVLQEKEKETSSGAAAAILKHGIDADEALKAFMGYDVGELVLDEETNKRLLRKIDWNIMPVSLPVPSNLYRESAAHRRD